MSKFIRKLPDDATCIELLKKGMTVPEILRKYNCVGTSSTTLEKIANKHRIVINQKKRGPNKIIIDKSAIKVDRNDFVIQKSRYAELDNFEIGQVIQLDGHKWSIEKVYKGNAKRYDCITEMGGTVQHRTYYCLDLRRGVML